MSGPRAPPRLRHEPQSTPLKFEERPIVAFGRAARIPDACGADRSIITISIRLRKASDGSPSHPSRASWGHHARRRACTVATGSFIESSSDLWRIHRADG